MRAEALIQLNDRRIADAISLINDVRSRAAGSTTLIFNYKEEYGVNFKVTPYELKAYTQEMKEQVEAKDAKLQETGYRNYSK